MVIACYYPLNNWDTATKYQLINPGNQWNMCLSYVGGPVDSPLKQSLVDKAARLVCGTGLQWKTRRIPRRFHPISELETWKNKTNIVQLISNRQSTCKSIQKVMKHLHTPKRNQQVECDLELTHFHLIPFDMHWARTGAARALRDSCWRQGALVANTVAKRV